MNHHTIKNFKQILIKYWKKKSKILKQKPAKSMIQIQTIVQKYNP